MKVNKESNSYTIIFAVIMVVVVGSVLSIVASTLKPYQVKNVENEKKKNILSAIGVEVELGEAAGEFEKYVKGGKILSFDGEILVDDLGKTFEIDVQKEYKSITDVQSRNYPIYECVTKDGENVFVIPMVGTGLWGPVWGFVALKEDMNTIYGANFDHKTETPGLGADINKPAFYDQFKNKSVLGPDGNVRLSVVKAGTGADYDNFDVDGISGGTITSVGVDEMLKRTLGVYKSYNKSTASN